MIPKKLHYVHTKKLTKVEKEWIEQSKKNNPDFSINIWDESNTNNLDISKSKIISREGGICVSPNIVFVDKIPSEWLEFKAIVSKKDDWYLSSEIMGGNKNCRFFVNFYTENFDITSLAFKTFGHYSLKNPKNNKLVDSDLFKCLEKPKLFPHNFKKILKDDSIYKKMWDNITSNKKSKLNVIEI